MIYKEFGKTGIKVSCLGFGAMRLPMKEVPSDKKDENKKIVDDD
jgi:predicted aldo/keto reductase-like oxidoreductase